MIEVELNQSSLKGGQRIPIKLVQKVAGLISGELKVKKKWNISLAFVSDKKIKELNKSYRKKNSVTDVLSFGLDGESAEIVISYQQAKRQAKEQGHSTRNEIVFLIVHGLLHVQGHDHEKPSEAKKMFGLQEKILKKLGVSPKL